MNDSDMQRLITILEEIRGNQRLQLDRQAEALSLEREQFASYCKLHEDAMALSREHLTMTAQYRDRIEQIQTRTDRSYDRAEAIQAKNAQIVAASRKIFAILVPIVIVLIAYASWLLFHLHR